MRFASTYLAGLVIAAVIACMSLTAALAQSGSMENSKSSSAQSAMNNNGTISMADKKFARDAAEGGLAEVELGKLAEERASNEEVKKFGERMVNDHSKANDKLKEVAKAEGIDLPTELSAKDRRLKDRLSKLSGQEFDRVYMKNMVADHKEDISGFEREDRAGSNPEIKQFASTTLPTLKDHLSEAEKVSRQTGSETASAR